MSFTDRRIVLGRKLILGGVVVDRYVARDVARSHVVEVQELGVGEESQLRVEVEGLLLLLLLLHGLIVWRRDGIQIVQILREIGRTTTVVA